MKLRRWIRQRYRLKRNKINFKKWRRIVILSLIVWGIFQFLGFMYLNVYTVVMDYAATQTVNIATLVIKEGINRSQIDSYSGEDFIMYPENSSQNSVVNTPLINQLRVSITQEIEEVLLLVESGDLSQLGLDNIQEGPFREGVLLEVPWAAALNLSLFHQWGPKVPVRATVIGNVVSDIETEVTPFGINNALLEVIINVEVKVHVALPFRSQEERVEVAIPLVTTTIEGDIPHLYFDGISVN